MEAARARQESFPAASRVNDKQLPHVTSAGQHVSDSFSLARGEKDSCKYYEALNKKTRWGLSLSARARTFPVARIESGR